MNRHAEPSISPLFIAQSTRQNFQLIKQMIKREIIGRYKGSFMGIAWSFATPILMLFVYTFFFSVVFQAKWSGASNSKTEFAMVLFAGLIFFNLFAECINKAPTIILANVNFVKKIVFPLELLAFINVGAALFHFIISFIIWLVFYTILFSFPPITILLLPLVMLPLLLLIIGLSWFLSSLGVYLRDVSQFIGILTSMLMFVSPIFFPITSLPEKYQKIIEFNPLTQTIEQARKIMIWGEPIQWKSWGIYFSLSLLISLCGFIWFQKTRKGFADVI